MKKTVIYFYKNKCFLFYTVGEKIVISSAKDILITVHYSNDFVIKINKKSISGIDGAIGILNFFERCISNNIGCCYIDKIIDKFYFGNEVI